MRTRNERTDPPSRTRDGASEHAAAGRATEGESIASITDLCKVFGEGDGAVTALDGVSLEVSAGEFVVLLGPSGCGKTTLLRSVAGLEQPTSGAIAVNGTPVYSSAERIDVKPEHRELGMMFQSYALWPHMSVSDNVGFPLRTRRVRKDVTASRVASILESVGIPELESRRPSQLSGGQQQRVALARALVGGENLILFDEPLSNVDAQVRDRLRMEIVRLQREHGFAALYVTHDQVEALSLADRIVVMDRGRVAQIGSPAQIYFEPASLYVANFVGSINEVEVDGELVRDTADNRRGQTAYGPVIGRPGDDDLVGSTIHAVWRPERSLLSIDEPAAVPNRWRGTIEHVVFYGSETEVHVRLDQGVQKAVMSTGAMRVAVGDDIWIGVEAGDVRFVASAP